MLGSFFKQVQEGREEEKGREHKWFGDERKSGPKTVGEHPKEGYEDGESV